MTKIIYREFNGAEHVLDVRAGLSVMEAAVQNNLPGIDAECGGVCACATCQVYVDAEWLARLPAMSEEEKGMLEFANHVQPNSRLSCQINVDDSLEGLVVTLPENQR